MLFGNLTCDPELKALPSGSAVCNFGLATNRIYTKDGEKKQETQFHNVVFFGKQADVIAQHMKKGDSMFVEGRLQTKTWEKDGKRMERLVVIGEGFQFGPKVEKPTKMETVEITPDDIPF